MGIDNLNEIITARAPRAMFKLHLRNFARRSIAIDGPMWIYANLAAIRKRHIAKIDVTQGMPNILHLTSDLTAQCLQYIARWLQYDITPIFVFDGPPRPEKTAVMKTRNKTKVDKLGEIMGYYDQIAALRLADPLARPPSDLVAKLSKALTGYNKVPAEMIDQLRVVLQGVGVPTLKAAHDAEELCSRLCVEGQVAAVFSKDGDTLPYGAPLVITSFDDSNHDIVNCVRLDYVLLGLNYTFPMFVDMCIMLKCDFNVNIKNVGKKRAMELMDRLLSIEAIAAEKDVRVLNHVRCREIFSYVPSDSIAEVLPEPPVYNREGMVLPVDVAAIPSTGLAVNVHAMTRIPAYLKMLEIEPNVYYTFMGLYKKYGDGPRVGGVDDLGLTPIADISRAEVIELAAAVEFDILETAVDELHVDDIFEKAAAPIRAKWSPF